MIMWIDTETTGLDPQNDCMLEIALLLTDDDLNHKAWYSQVIAPADRVLVDTMIPLVKEMHTNNGLLMDLEALGLKTFGEVQIECLQWLKHLSERYSIEDWRKVPLGGSSVIHDRNFLRRWMPFLEAAFHYRSIDVSSFKEMLYRWYGKERVPGTPEDQKAHRALGDIRASVGELKKFREKFFLAPELVEIVDILEQSKGV